MGLMHGENAVALDQSTLCCELSTKVSVFPQNPDRQDSAPIVLRVNDLDCL